MLSPVLRAFLEDVFILVVFIFLLWALWRLGLLLPLREDRFFSWSTVLLFLLSVGYLLWVQAQYFYDYLGYFRAGETYTRQVSCTVVEVQGRDQALWKLAQGLLYCQEDPRPFVLKRASPAVFPLGARVRLDYLPRSRLVIRAMTEPQNGP